MAQDWVEYKISTYRGHKYIVDDDGNHIFWLKDNGEVWSTDGKTKHGFLKYYDKDWDEIKGISYLAYVKR